MNTSQALTESTKDLQALAAQANVLGSLEEPWFDEAPVSSRRSSAPPPSGVVRMGEFLGDPLADAWLR